MAYRAFVLPQQPKTKVSQKMAGEERSRQVLRDIGNLAIDRPLEGKPLPQPATMKCPQLLTTKQAAAGKNRKENDRARLEKGGVIKDTASQKKEPEKPTTEEAAMLSPIADKNLKNDVKSLDQAACESQNKLEEPIVNIDEVDADNELAAVEYIDDMHTFYKLTENEDRVDDYMGSQKNVDVKMRSILIDWLIEVHRKFELIPETLYLSVNIVDRFLSKTTVQKKELQLVGISSMLLACKYEEIWAPEVNDFVSISANSYAREQVLIMEKTILEKLQWRLTVPTPYVFLVRYIKASESSDKEMENAVHFLAELGLMHYPTMVSRSPSMVAASAVYAARCTLEKNPTWTATLEHHTGYGEDQILDCAKILVGLHLGATENTLKAVYRKFKNHDRCAVALLRPAAELSGRCLDFH